MVRNYTDEQLLSRVKSIPTYKRIPSGRWILGVRSNEDTPNKFDDKFYEFEGERFIRVLEGTTNPGVKVLRSFEKYNRLGAAVLKSDEWYYDVWKYGLHRGRVPGLLQLGSKVKVFRDDDRDVKAEELGSIQEGWFGINFHTNTYNLSAPNLKIKQTDVNDWSAGCQVTNDREKYADMMQWYSLASKNGTQTHVSYCLINEF